jgi:hypothetical protein
VLARLPATVCWTLSAVSWSFNFERVRSELLPATTMDAIGHAVDPDWSSLYLFGEEYYDGGASPVLGIQLPSGEVRGLDLERDRAPVFFLNSGAREFVDTINALDRTLRLGALPAGELRSVLASIDPAGFPRSEWQPLVAELADRP